MPLTAFCPHCRQAVDLERLPFERCPKCGEAFPADFARDLEARFTPRRPLLLNLQLFLGWIFGVLGLLTLPFAFETQDFSQLEALGVRIPSIPGLPMAWRRLRRCFCCCGQRGRSSASKRAPAHC
jgi:hypothetical protein